MKKVVLFIILFAILSSCIQQAKRGHVMFENVDPYQIAGKSKVANGNKGLDIHIDYKKIDKNSVIKFSDVFDSIGFLKLESNSESMIGSVNKLCIEAGFYYILDTYKAKTLKKFNQDGLYVATFGKIGSGPEEIQEITDFFVNSTGVIIYDQFKSKLFYYSLDGEFLCSKSVPFILNSFFYFSDNEYIFHLFDSDNYHIPDILGYSILKTDSNFVVENKTSFREKDKYTNHVSKNDIVFSNNTYYYHPPFNDTIFSINKDGSLNYDYIFNFGKYSLPDEFLLRKNKKRKREAWNNEEYVMFVGDFIPTEHFVYTTFSMQGDLYHSFYSNKTGNIVCGRYTLDDMYYSFSLSNILSSKGNTLIDVVNAYQIKESIRRMNLEELKSHLPQGYLEFWNSIDDDDNPIIAFYKLKDQL